MALIDEVYGDWGLRPMTDIDLWVSRPNDRPLRQALVELGYASQPFYPDTLRRGCVAVEIHTSLLGSERIAARDRILADGQMKPFERAHRFSVAGAHGWRLDPQDAVLFACLHLLKHNACRLLWLLEIDAMLAGWSSEEVAILSRRAHSAGQWHAVGLVSYLANDLLVRAPSVTQARAASHDDDRGGDAGLAELMVAPAPPPLARRALERRRARGKLPVWGPLVFFNAGGKPRERLMSVLETLFPRPSTLRQIFRDQDAWLATLYVRRFFQLVEMAMRS
jgi:hypothetical protein